MPDRLLAFPVIGNPNQQGMCIRDYFAGQAVTPMIKMLASAGVHHALDGEQFATAVAAGAYNIADAMIKERDKEK